MSFFDKPLFLYRPPYGKHYHEDFETLRFMIDAGVRTVVLSPMNTLNSFGEPYSEHPPIWKWFQTCDFNILESLIQEVLKISPEIRFILTIDLNSPQWLSRRLLLDSFYSLGEISLHSRWKEETTAYLRAFINYCETRHRERVCGYILACGRTLEWIESRNDKPGPAKCAAYTQWCRERGLPENPPDFAQMDLSAHGFLRDPQTEKTKIQWLRFCNELTGRLAEDFIRIARASITNGSAIGLFFGHTMYASAGGHNECEQVFDRAAPDFVIGAACNTEQTIGGNGGFNVAEFMLKNRNICFLSECDRLTSTSNLQLSEFIRIPETGHWVRWKTVKEDVAGFRREVGMALIHSFSFWPFNIWGNSYRSSELRDTIRSCIRIWKRYAGKSGKSASQILLVADPESNYYVNMRYPVVPNVLGWKLRGKILPESGTAFDTAHFQDLSRMELDCYKLIIFQNLFVVGEEKERILREKICRNGRTVLFLYAPGIIRKNRYDPTNVERICGTPYAPSGLFIRRYSDWISVYLADVEQLNNPGVFTSILQTANPHIYSPGAAVWVSEHLLQIHHAKGGRHPVVLPHPIKRITELFSQRVVGENCCRFSDEFQEPDTKLYLLEN